MCVTAHITRTGDNSRPVLSCHAALSAVPVLPPQGVSEVQHTLKRERHNAIYATLVIKNKCMFKTSYLQLITFAFLFSVVSPLALLKIPPSGLPAWAALLLQSMSQVSSGCAEASLSSLIH